VRDKGKENKSNRGLRRYDESQGIHLPQRLKPESKERGACTAEAVLHPSHEKGLVPTLSQRMRKGGVPGDLPSLPGLAV
jgi:hypothetical protein